MKEGRDANLPRTLDCGGHADNSGSQGLLVADREVPGNKSTQEFRWKAVLEQLSLIVFVVIDGIIMIILSINANSTPLKNAHNCLKILVLEDLASTCGYCPAANTL